MRQYDAIVVGVGAMGSAALYHLARRGLHVVGLEQYAVGHDRGSAHGSTRIIRQSYFEHPDYVPLVRQAYDGWRELERASGRQVFVRSGLLLIGPGDGPLIRGVREAAAAHHIELQDITLPVDAGPLAGFAASERLKAVLESQAGFLHVEEGVRAHAEQARACGAEIVEACTVQRWETDGNGVTVHTTDQVYHGERLVLCGGAWSSSLLADLGLPLEVRRKVLLWYPPEPAYTLDNGCPVFAYDLAEGFYYGFPAHGSEGVKVACHSGGNPVHDPAAVDRRLHDTDRLPVETFCRRYLPRLNLGLLDHTVCLYTMSADQHFIVDRHPDHQQICFAAGFSGHGYKFAPLIGSVLADLTITGRTDQPVGFLQAGRFGIRER